MIKNNKQLKDKIIFNFNSGNYDQAKLLLSYALKKNPNNFEYLNLIGYLCGIKNNYQEAKFFLEKAHTLKPNDATVIFNLANALCDLNEFDNAIELLIKAEALSPNKPNLFYLHAKCLLKIGNITESINYFQKTLILKLNFEFLFEFCNLLANLGFLQEAIDQYNDAIRLDPNIAGVYVNKGVLLHQLGLFDDAILQYNIAIRLDPNLPEVWLNKGVTLSKLRYSDQAIDHYKKSLILKQNYPEALANIGSCLNDLHQFGIAISYFDKAINLKPNFPHAYANKGFALSRTGDHKKSADCYLIAFSQSNEDNFYLGKALHQFMLCCDWRRYNELALKIEKALSSGKKSADPFGYQAISTSEYNLSKCAKIYCESLYPSTFTNRASPSIHSKIRIGYVCGEFREQATSILLTRVLELHDRTHFQIYAFDSGFGDNSTYRRRIENAFGDNFFNISNRSNTEVFNLIRGLEIDILVNLNGYFGNMRQEVFAMGPCPINVNFLGFPGTLGANYFDYLIADKIVIPENSKQYYSEKIIYLPNSYQPNDDKKIFVKQLSKKDHGLPDGSEFIFCSFNNSYKITPDFFEIWMRILKSVNSSVLWLLESNPSASFNLKEEASRRGVNADRIIFAKRLPYEEHLCRHQLADLFLDTLPYNAHTTASDALWSGLPVLTCLGNTFPGRVASSLLNAINLPELITTSLVQYENLAIELAKNPNNLIDIREKLKTNRLSSSLFNCQLYTSNLEDIYTTMYEDLFKKTVIPPQSNRPQR